MGAPHVLMMHIELSNLHVTTSQSDPREPSALLDDLQLRTNAMHAGK